MLLGKVLSALFSAILCNLLILAQRLGLTLGLSVAGSIFVNKALEDLGHALPNKPRAQILSAITGTSGSVFHSLAGTDQITASDTLTIALRKVYVLSATNCSIHEFQLKESRFIPVYAAGALGLVASVFLDVSSLLVDPRLSLISAVVIC